MSVVSQRVRLQSHYHIYLTVGISLVVLCCMLSLCLGNYPTSPGTVIQSVLHPEFHANVLNILVLSRLPRLIASLTVGAALSTAGLVYQEIFSNSMASPDILGVSAGAGCGAAFSIMRGYSFLMTGMFAFFGGLLAVGLTMTVAALFYRSSRSVSLILGGIVIGGMMNSFLGFMKYTSDVQQLTSITFWLLGGFDRVQYHQLIVAVPLILMGLLILYKLRWRVLMLRNGDEDASNHGIEAVRLRRFVIILSTVITALSICLSGTVGWIGLAIPNLMRLLSPCCSTHLMSLTIVYGMAFTSACDLAARTLSPTEIPVGVLTGSLGAILFITVLILKKRERDHD